MRKMVVGITGSSAPTMPSATITHPMQGQARRTTSVFRSARKLFFDVAAHCKEGRLGAGDHLVFLRRAQRQGIERRHELSPVLCHAVGGRGEVPRAELAAQPEGR